MKLQTFIYRLFFTRNDDLDVLQILFVITVGVSIYLSLFYAHAQGNLEIAKMVLEHTRWMMGLLLITAVPQWLVPYLTKKKDGNENQ